MSRICVFEGEGAAPEAMEPTLDLLAALDADLEFVIPSVEEYADQLAEGTVPAELQETIRNADTVLFGAAQGSGGWQSYMPILKWLRTEYGGGLPANVRRVKYFEGADSPLSDPDGVEYAVVRENLEGSFFGSSGVEGDLADLRTAFADSPLSSPALDAAGDGAFALRVTSEQNTRRYARLVCEYAQSQFDHEPVTVTCATKSNILSRTDGLFDAIVEETVGQYDGVAFEHLHVDNAAAQLVTNPQRFDLIVTTNMPGDILSDVGGATVGGLGVAHSGCFGDDAAYFEPVHGTAPDIVGENVINPTATILSAVLMLRYLGHKAAADRLENAVEAVYAAGEPLTPDQGGDASTTEMAAAIRDRL